MGLEKLAGEAKTYAALDDCELFSLFRAHSAKAYVIHKMNAKVSLDLKNRDEIRAQNALLNEMEESAVIAAACAELIRSRSKPDASPSLPSV